MPRKVKEVLLIKELKAEPTVNKERGMQLSAAWLDIVGNHGNRMSKPTSVGLGKKIE